MEEHKIWDSRILQNTAFSSWFVKFRWWIIGAVGFVLLALEVTELVVRGGNPGDFAEIIIYIALTGILSLLIEMTLASLARQRYVTKILDARHQLSLKLISQESWEVLAAQLARFPCEIAPISHVQLYVRNSISNRFETAASWNEPRPGAAQPTGREYSPCQGCLKRQTRQEFLTSSCRESGGCHEYCFQIHYGYHLIAILQMTLDPQSQLTENQKDMLWNVKEDMAIALQAGLDRKKLGELQLAQTALSERRMVSNYLHDNLSQNLGYVRLKLDQWLTHPQALPQDMHPDAEQMLAAVKESYEIVRGKLETLHPETTPLITNLLAEHAHRVAARAKFAVEFNSQGQAVALPPEVQRAVFYVFQEALGNVEKHSGASRVVVVFLWNDSTLHITIMDDGRGFDVDRTQDNKHFGMQIMLERITNVNGSMEIFSSEKTGTTIQISVPLAFVEMEREGNL